MGRVWGSTHTTSRQIFRNGYNTFCCWPHHLAANFQKRLQHFLLLAISPSHNICWPSALLKKFFKICLIIQCNTFCVIFLAMNSSLPDWMDVEQEAPLERPKHVPIPLNQMSDQERQLELQTFGIAFESSLEQIASGTTIEQFCQRYVDPLGRCLSHGRFRAWIYRDEKRRNAFYAAKALAAEAIEDELLRISDGMLADGSVSMDDTARSQLRIQTRWKLLQVYNRKRYGDVKTVEQTNTTKVEIQQMTTDELKKYILSQSGIDIEHADFSTDG